MFDLWGFGAIEVGDMVQRTGILDLRRITREGGEEISRVKTSAKAIDDGCELEMPRVTLCSAPVTA